MAVVFAVLGMLWAVIRIFSLIIGQLENRKAKTASKNSKG
jgi:Na+-transporting methylmalonyl-CoA/oxaloacetate decarboxylase gamma subunit